MGKKEKYKTCRPGDHIHILVTRDFTDTATQFFRICKDEHFNPSEIIRSAIADWVSTQKEKKRVLSERNIDNSNFMKEMADAYEEAILYRK